MLVGLWAQGFVLGGEVRWTPRTSRRSDPVRHHRLSPHSSRRLSPVRLSCGWSPLRNSSKAALTSSARSSWTQCCCHDSCSYRAHLIACYQRYLGHLGPSVPLLLLWCLSWACTRPGCSRVRVHGPLRAARRAFLALSRRGRGPRARCWSGHHRGVTPTGAAARRCLSTPDV